MESVNKSMKTLIDKHNGYSVEQAVALPKDKLAIALILYNERNNLPVQDYANMSEDELRNEYLTKIFDFAFE